MASTERDVAILGAMQTALEQAIQENVSRINSLSTAPSTRSVCRAKDQLMREQYSALGKAIGLMRFEQMGHVGQGDAN